MITSNRKYTDLRNQTSTGGGGIPQQIINIIEQNTGTQADVKVLYTEMVYTDGNISSVKKYTDSGKATMVYDISITWLGGVPVTIVSNNLDDDIITTTTLVWLDGLLQSANKVES